MNTINFKTSILFLILGFVFITKSSSQELTLDWFPKVGSDENYIQLIQIDENVFPLPKGGESGIWDYSGIVSSIGHNGYDTRVRWEKPQEGIFYDTLTSLCTHLMIDSTFGSFWEHYYNIDGDNIYSAGSAYKKTIGDVPSLVHQRFTNESLFLYNGFQLGESINGGAVLAEEVEFFGTGTLITPLGTYDDCIAIRTISESVIRYLERITWYQGNLNNEIARYDYLESDFISDSPSIHFRYNLRSPTISSLDLISKQKFKIFPNPMSNYFIFENADNSYIEDAIIVDLKGREIFRKTINSKRDIIEVELPKTTNGLYNLKIKTKNQTWTKKIIINN